MLYKYLLCTGSVARRQCVQPKIWLMHKKKLGIYHCVAFHFELLPIACYPLCLHYCTGDYFWDLSGALESLTEMKSSEQSSGHLTQQVTHGPSSQNLEDGRKLILSHPVFSTCFKCYNLSRCLMGYDKAMSWWGDETQLCCVHMWGTEQKILQIGK